MADQPLNALTKRRQAANMTEAGKRALGHQLAPYIRSYVDASKFGVVYDTTIDSSVAVQAAIDASKGKALVFTGEFSARNVKMADSTYNDTRIICEGRWHMPTDGMTNTPGLNVPAALHIGTASGIVLHFRGHGERASKGNREQISMLMLAGSTNLDIPEFDVIECRGDGVYISHLGVGALGAICNGVRFGRFSAVNSSIDGRNAVSIITGRNISIESLWVDGFGRLQNAGPMMPGGFDIEPDHDYEIVENISIGKAYIRTVGQAGFAVHGRGAIRTRNVSCMDLMLENYADPNTVDEYAAMTQQYGDLVKVVNSDNVRIRGEAKWVNAYGNGLIANGNRNCSIDLTLSHVNTGAITGGAPILGGISTEERCNYNLSIRDVSRYGWVHGAETSCRLTGDISGAVTTHYSNRFANLLDGAAVRSRYSVAVDDATNWTRAYRHNSGTYDRCVLHDVDLSNHTTVNNRVDDTVMMRENVGGVTDAAAQPNDGSWIAGQFVRDTARTVTANGNIRVGWERMTTGSANVASTDWRAVYVKTVDTV